MFRSHKFHFAIVAVATLALISQSSAANQLCIDIYRKVHATLEQAYSQAKATKTGQQEATAIIDLLNETFSPILFDFKNLTTELTISTVQSRYHKVEESKIFFETFSQNWRGNNTADISKGAPEMHQLLPHLADQANSFYRVNAASETFQYREYLYTSVDQKHREKFGRGFGVFSTVVTPVGDYGKSFAQDMLRTTQILIDLTVDKLEMSARKTYTSAPTLLNENAARAMFAHSFDHVSDIKLAPLNAMVEGIVSFHQLVNLLLANKIPGIENGVDALRAIVNADSKLGLTSEITMQLPMGFTAPTTYSGYGLKNALRFEGNRLILAPQTKEYFRALKDKTEKLHNKRRRCPVASFLRISKPKPENHEQLKAQSGIQIIAEAYLKVFEIVQAERLATTKTEM